MQRQGRNAQPWDGTRVPKIPSARNDPGFLFKGQLVKDLSGVFGVFRHGDILLKQDWEFGGKVNLGLNHSGQEQDRQDDDEHANQQQDVEIERSGFIDGAEATGDVLFGLGFEIDLADDHVHFLIKLGQPR